MALRPPTAGAGLPVASELSSGTDEMTNMPSVSLADHGAQSGHLPPTQNNVAS